MKTFELKHFENKEDWRLWTHNGITAEDAAIIMDENPWETREELLVRKANVAPAEKPVTEAMERGRNERPKALELYKALSHLPELAPANIANVSRPWQICHVDGLDFATWHLAEIRCGEAAYQRAKGKTLPPRPYWAECQHILATTGLRLIHLYFHTTLSGEQPITMKVWRSDKYIQKLIEAEKEFLNEMFALRANQTEILTPQKEMQGEDIVIAQELAINQITRVLASEIKELKTV